MLKLTLDKSSPLAALVIYWNAKEYIIVREFWWTAMTVAGTSLPIFLWTVIAEIGWCEDKL